MELKVDELATHLAADMEKEDLKGRTLTLKLKTSEFRVRPPSLVLQQLCQFLSLL
jgi:DNA polymerase kappa